MGNARSQTSVSKNLKEMSKHEKTLSFRDNFSYKIHAGTSKATHKVFQQRGVSSVREFFVLHNLQFFVWKLWLKIGCIFKEAYDGIIKGLYTGKILAPNSILHTLLVLLSWTFLTVYFIYTFAKKIFEMVFLV